jgi:hypothetical protein
LQALPAATPPSAAGWPLFGATEADIERQLLHSIEFLDQPVAPSQPYFYRAPGAPGASTPDASPDALAAAIHRQLLPPEADDSDSSPDQIPHWSLLPILSFGPLVAVQSAAVNRESLRLLFDAHRLGDHLSRLRAFFLLGDPTFCRRLSHALFDPHMDSAERRAGVAMHAGAAMGLRLGTRSSWPPASSELRLALMGLLSEAQVGRQDPDHDSSSETMSFSVRQLPPDEVERVLDPTSLQALDFLRLSYRPPDALASILSPAAILKCDAVFKLLLRMLRMQFVVGQISRRLTCRAALGDRNRRYRRRAADDAATAAALRFAATAHHFVATVSAYFANTAIAAPWKEFCEGLDGMRAAVAVPESPMDASLGAGGGDEATAAAAIPGPERIRNDLQQVLDKVLEGLFLRKRQQPVMKLLEEILGVILELAKLQQRQDQVWRLDNPDAGDAIDYAGLNRRLHEHVGLFVAVCRGLADEGRGRRSRLRVGSSGSVQESPIGRLVCLLDYSGFYGRVD